MGLTLISTSLGSPSTTRVSACAICARWADAGSKPASNVYVYQPSPAASIAAYGAGCTGSGGPMALTADNLPWTLPATIEDPVVLDEIKDGLKGAGFAAKG